MLSSFPSPAAICVPGFLGRQPLWSHYPFQLSSADAASVPSALQVSFIFNPNFLTSPPAVPLSLEKPLVDESHQFPFPSLLLNTYLEPCKRWHS